ncbi:MAG: hypothetical protein ACI9K2_006406, partial [Myxococcota bacterium]
EPGRDELHPEGVSLPQRRRCPSCDQEGDVETLFGWRHPGKRSCSAKAVDLRPQSLCSVCR